MSDVQGSITVVRTRQGDTITTLLDPDKALYQGYNESSEDVQPSWTVDANRPTITPKSFSSLKGEQTSYIAGSIVWKYNYQTLTFDSETHLSTGTYAGLFLLNPTTGALKIMGNLASPTNKNVDKLDFEAVCNTGYENPVKGRIEIKIEIVGGGSYTGLVDTTSKTLKEDVCETITATARLLFDGTASSSFKVAFKKGDGTVVQAKSTTKTLSITRSMVEGSQLYIAEFYATIDGSDVLVSTYQFVIYDTSDPYEVLIVPADGINELTDSKTSLRFNASVRKRFDNSVVTADSWSFVTYNCRAKQITLATAHGSNYVVVTTADCDRIEAGETEVNGDITIVGTATITI